jgi:hypothetical protein
MAATHTPHADKIRWHKVGDPTKGGVSRFGEYVVTNVIALRRPDGSREIVPAPSISGYQVYHACVEHNKRLLGID